jgi:hypothetical protein
MSLQDTHVRERVEALRSGFIAGGVVLQRGDHNSITHSSAAAAASVEPPRQKATIISTLKQVSENIHTCTGLLCLHICCPILYYSVALH